MGVPSSVNLSASIKPPSGVSMKDCRREGGIPKVCSTRRGCVPVYSAISGTLT